MATAEERPPEPGEGPSSRRVPPLPRSAYEFTPDENVLIGKLASQMHFVGLFAIGIGILVIAAGLLGHHLGSILSGAFYALIGIWTHRASVSFKNVVQTEGYDLHHLLYAIEDLRKFFNLLFWVCFLALVIALCVLAAAVVLLVRGG